ncbi:MAG TPA: APC family permease [Solirubrobacteraceae bacterium]|jgi:amino acid transporter|nr:APC family permease [Solirubrobacteraceae bacterium]
MAQVAVPPSPDPRNAALDADGLDRGVGFLGLLWASEGSIIGSGWLFGALTAASIAGPSALVAWVIASLIVIVLALVHAELGGLFPVSGGTSRFPHYAFGSLAGGTFGWFAYIQGATVAPIEVLAAIQYLSSVSWAKGLYNGSTGSLTATGILVAIVLMFAFVVLNLVGIRFLTRVNNALTSWKVFIPIMTFIVLLLTHFHSGNFSGGGGFFVKGAELKDVLIAMPNGGIVFALLGFEQAVQLGGESRNPKRDLPRAVIFSVLIGAAIYILVQIAFIGALDPKLLAQAGTWRALATPGKNPLLSALNAAPFYSVAKVAGLAWLAVILRIDAVVSPSGTGLIYLTTSSRISFGLSKNGYVPAAFEKSSERTKVPVLGVIITALIGLLFLLPFPSWSKLVGVVTSASVLMYAGAPLALGALRRQKPDLPRAYMLPWGHVLAPLSFVLANFIVYWAGWGTYSTLMIVMALGYLLMIISGVFKLNPNRPEIDWGAAAWLFPYLIGMGVISYFGGFGSTGILGGVGVFKTVLVGGTGDLKLGYDLLVLAIFSLIIYYAAMAKRLSSAQVDQYVREVYPPPVAE